MRKLLLIAVAACLWAFPSHAFMARGQIGNTGIPILLSAPTVSPSPTTTQATSLGGPFAGNTVSAVGDTWQNCSPCTFEYRWYYYTKGAITIGATASSYTTPNLDTIFWPEFSSYGDTAVFAFVTATNSFGSTTTTTPITTVTRAPVNTVGGGTLQLCTTSACTSFSPAGNTLAVGDWVIVTGILASGSGYIAPPSFYIWQTDGTGGPAQAWFTVQNISTEPYQLQTVDGSKNIRMGVRYNFSSPLNGGNTSGYNSFPVGPIVPITNPGGTMPLPISTGLAPITESPIVPPSSPLQAYIGFILSPALTSAIGSWLNVPWNFTYQWMYCSTAPGSGVAAPCGANPNAAKQATGTFTFGANPGNGNTINLNGTVWTFVNTLTTGNQILIDSGGNLQATLANASGALNGSSDANTALMAYASTSTTIIIVADVFSAAGNAYTLAASNATPSGATLSGGLTASGASLVGTALPNNTTYNYLVTSADNGRQIFVRVTAINTAGTTVQDMLPTAAAIPPGAPVATVQPSLSGYATVGDVGGGTGGGQLVGNPGTWAGPPTNYTYDWYSCTPAVPSCAGNPAFLATGPSILHVLNVNPAVIEPVYQNVTADLGNTIVMRVTAFNSTRPLGVTADTPASNVTTTFSQTALGAGPLGVYPAGRDPLTTYTCAPAPTSYGTTYYVNNQTGSDSNNGTTPSTPFLTYAKASGLVVPGGRILLQGVAAYDSTPGQVGNYGAISGSGNNVTGGVTNWITIGADTSTGSKPMLTSASFSGRGWNLDGLWIKNASTFVAGSGITNDFIFQNGFIGYYPDLATAEFDYNHNCVSLSCGYNSIGEWLSGFNGLPNHVVDVGFDARGTGPNTSQCVSIINNKFWFMQVGVDIQLFAQDVLVEGNDFAYFTVDAVDVGNRYPAIYHLNTIHDPISPLNIAQTPHQDAFQTQPFGTSFELGAYGWEFDSNKEILNIDPAMNSFVDQPYCTAHGLVPCSSFPISIVGDESCMQFSNGFTVGTRFVNNLCLYTAQGSFNASTLMTVANNTFLGWDQSLHIAPNFGEVASTDSHNYWANNASDIMDCYKDNIPGFSTFASNVLIPLGPNPPASPGAASANCNARWGVVDNSGVNPFTATSVANGPTGVIPDPSAFVTEPASINLIPPSGSSLFQTGSAAHFVPTFTINGTAHTSPPNVGAY